MDEQAKALASEHGLAWIKPPLDPYASHDLVEGLVRLPVDPVPLTEEELARLNVLDASYDEHTAILEDVRTHGLPFLLVQRISHFPAAHHRRGFARMPGELGLVVEKRKHLVRLSCDVSRCLLCDDSSTRLLLAVKWCRLQGALAL